MATFPVFDERAAAVHRCIWFANGAQISRSGRSTVRVFLSERDTLAALWRLAAAGFLAPTYSFAPLRLLAADPAATTGAITDAPRAANGSTASIKHDAALRARLKSSLSGRWSGLDPDGCPA